MYRLIVLFCLFYSLTILSAAEEAGYLSSVSGKPSITCTRNKIQQELKVNDQILEGDTLRTVKGQKAIIKLTVYSDQPKVFMGPESEITFRAVQENPEKSSILMRIGKLFFKGAGDSHRGFRIETYNSVAGVEGTSFDIAYFTDKNLTTVNVYEGTVKLQKLSDGKVVSPILPGALPLILKEGESGQVEGVKMTKISGKMDPEAIKTGLSSWVMAEETNSGEKKHDLVTNGSFSVPLVFKTSEQFPIPVPVSVRVYINGAKTLNGQELVYNASENTRVVLENLEEDTYRLSLVCCGFTHETQLAVPLASGEEAFQINYRKNTVNMDIKGLNRHSSNGFDRIYKEEFVVSVNSVPVPVLNESDNVSQNPEAIRYTMTGKLYFYTPDEPEVYPVRLKFRYRGTRKIMKAVNEGVTIDGDSVEFLIRQDCSRYSGSFELK